MYVDIDIDMDLSIDIDVNADTDMDMDMDIGVNTHIVKNLYIAQKKFSRFSGQYSTLYV